jgi:hypothetical protein
MCARFSGVRSSVPVLTEGGFARHSADSRMRVGVFASEGWAGESVLGERQMAPFNLMHRSVIAVAAIALTFLLQAPAGALPADMSGRGAYARAASDTKTAVTQAIVYAQDKGVYPTSLRVLREAGYANLPDMDPWGNDYVLSPVLTGGNRRQTGDDVFVYSKGPKGTGTYSIPSTPGAFISDTGKNGSVGYS